MTALEESTAGAIKPASGVILSGVDTLVRLLVLRAQVDRRDGLTTATMVSGYPGSPLATVDLSLEKMGAALAENRIVHRPGLNEELALSTVWGSQMGAAVAYEGIDGVAGAWYGKGPGLDRSGDSLKHANAMGAGPNGGVVVFCGDDPASKSSTLACDSQYTFEDAAIPVLYPGDQQDLLDLGIHAFAMSRWSGTWVGVKTVTTVADGIGSVDLDPARYGTSVPTGILIDGETWRHRPLATVGPHAVPDQEALVLERRLTAAKAYARHNGLDRVVGAGADASARASLGIVAAGKTYFDLVQAFANVGIPLDTLADRGIRLLKLAMTYPLVEETALEFAASVEELLVVEEKRPFVETQLRAILHEAGSRVPLSGKRDRSGRKLVSSVGELDATSIGVVLGRVRADLAPRQAPATRTSLPLLTIPARPPGFCSGCPHNRSTVAPEGALVGGGVGCHGIMYFEPRNAEMRRLPPTPMGSEGVPWIGLAPFVADPHLIQNLGDGTLSHSGTLAIRASVAAGVNVTFKILYNKAVAMTGGQDVAGGMEVPAMTRALEAEGVARVVVVAEQPDRYGRKARWAPGVKVYHRDSLDDVQRELESVPGTTVIIYDQQCAAEARRLRKKGLQEEPPQRVVINEAVCEGCGDCGVKSNCLSVLPLETEFGTKRQIHDPSCNRDYTCLQGDCPSFVTLTPTKRRGRPAPPETPESRKEPHAGKPVKAKGPRVGLPAGTLPTPEPATFTDQYCVYFTGIGGTGVVTANRILAAAADISGLVIGGIDQTGLSQKAGAVVSHLRFARSRDALGAAAVGADDADLYLSGDILQAAGPAHLAKVKPGRALAVVDSVVTPTVSMMQGALTAPDVPALEQAIADRIGEDRVAFLDSEHIADTVFSNHLLANIVLLGAAFQLGGLPFSLADVEAAIGQQGKAAESNQQAFAWGRWTVHDPSAVATALAGVGHGEERITDPSPDALSTASALVAQRSVPAPLLSLVTRRAAQAVDYQSAATAGRYLDLVERVAATDDAGHGWALTRSVAEQWYRVLAYKDEYEVARLHLKVDYDEVAGDLGIEGDYKVTYHLHPPTLRRMGLKKKLPAGKPYEVAFRAMRRMKRLRGTPLDIFGYDPDRKLERELIGEYESLVRDALGLPYETAVRLTDSIAAVKGYAGIKEASVATWRADVATIRREATPTAQA